MSGNLGKYFGEIDCLNYKGALSYSKGKKMSVLTCKMTTYFAKQAGAVLLN